MSNIHGFQDARLREAAEARRNGDAQQAAPGGAADPAAQQNFFNFMPGQYVPQTKHPRNENFFEMWKFTFCPRFKFCSTIFFICLIQLVFFIAEIIHTSVEIKSLEPHFFIGIQLVTLQKFGMRMPWLIRTKGEIHRFLVPSVIHFGFCHFVINIILQLSIGTVVESALGSGRMAIFYLFVVFGSNIFGANCSSLYALGSEPIIFGFLASLFTMLLVYWNYIGGTTCTKICTFFSVAMVFIIAALLITQQAQAASFYTQSVKIVYPDLYGSIGGFLYGFFTAMFLLPVELKVNGKWNCYQLSIFFTGVGVITVMTIILVVVFFTQPTKPTQYWIIE